MVCYFPLKMTGGCDLNYPKVCYFPLKMTGDDDSASVVIMASPHSGLVVDSKVSGLLFSLKNDW
jgi:hypothetical protein